MRIRFGVLSNFIICLTLTLFLLSCETSRIISYSEINESIPPDKIELKDKTEFKIYSYSIGCKVSSDTLTLFNKKKHTDLAYIPRSSVEKITDDGRSPSDAPVFQVTFFMLAMLFLYYYLNK
jgi:hypothetical protein